MVTLIWLKWNIDILILITSPKTMWFIPVPLPCIVSDWSNWSAPDASGVRFRVRYMIRPALNGGKECQDLIQLGRGNI